MSQLFLYPDGTVSPTIKRIIPNVGPDVTPDAFGNVAIGGGNNITTDGTLPNILGINVSGTTDHAVQIGNATNSLTSLGIGNTAQVLKGNTGADPSWGAVDLTTDVSGVLPVGSGGTGVSTITAHSLVVGDGVNALNEIAVGATNQVLLGNTGADPSWGTVGNASLTNSSVTLSDGANITVTGSPLSLGGTATIALKTALTAIDSITNTNTPFTLNTGTGTIGISTDTATATVNIATGVGVKTVTVGSNNTTSQLVLQSGTNGLNINSHDGGLVINSGTGVLAISTDASATTLNMATGAAVKTVTIGSTTTTSSLDLKTGTGDFSLSSATGNLVDVTNLGVVTLLNDLDVTEGGTGVSSFTAYAVLCGGTTAAGDLQSVASVGTSGQVLTSNGAGALPTFQDAGGGGGMAWVNETGATKAMVVNEGYLANRVAGVLAFTLPAAAAVGDIVAIAGSQNGWSIAQNANQTIHFPSGDTTTGVGGSLASTNRYDCIELVCIVADSSFVARSMSGNITIV